MDVDGGFGTLLSYASKARRELPDDTVVLDGAVEPLGRRGTFAGQHLYTPLRGVAVQVNAFNFPVWGFLEKLAPGLPRRRADDREAGQPAAYLTEAVVRSIVESGLLPEGGAAAGRQRPGVLDGLDRQDLVFFTGSAATAGSCAAPVGGRRSVRFNAEADSLNCSVLGPDAAPGTPEFEPVHRPAGHRDDRQGRAKCTAIRRALVPGSWWTTSLSDPGAASPRSSSAPPAPRA